MFLVLMCYITLGSISPLEQTCTITEVNLYGGEVLLGGKTYKETILKSLKNWSEGDEDPSFLTDALTFVFISQYCSDKYDWTIVPPKRVVICREYNPEEDK